MLIKQVVWFGFDIFEGTSSISFIKDIIDITVNIVFDFDDV